MPLCNFLRALFSRDIQRLFADGPVLPLPVAPVAPAWMRGQTPPRQIDVPTRPLGRVAIAVEQSRAAAAESIPAELLPYR